MCSAIDLLIQVRWVAAPKMATSTLNESICEDIILYPLSHLLVMGQLCIRSGCNTEYHCNLILGRLHWLQLFTEPNVAYKFLKNPKSCMVVQLRFWHEKSVINRFNCNVYGGLLEKRAFQAGCRMYFICIDFHIRKPYWWKVSFANHNISDWVTNYKERENTLKSFYRK